MLEVSLYKQQQGKKEKKTNMVNNILKDIAKLEELHKKNPKDINLDHRLTQLRSELRAILISDQDKI